jgi:hypothetical protein
MQLSLIAMKMISLNKPVARGTSGFKMKRSHLLQQKINSEKLQRRVPLKAKM